MTGGKIRVLLVAVVVIAAEIPPYVIRSYQGAPSGMAIEVLEEAARRLKEPLTIELMPLARALSQTRHRQNVLLVPPVKSPQREPLFLWIAPLLEEAFVLVSHRQHHPAPLSVKALSGLTLGAMRGSHGQSLIQPLEGVTRELVTEEVSNASKLARGRIQALGKLPEDHAATPLRETPRVAALVREFPPKREITDQGELVRGLPVRLAVQREGARCPRYLDRTKPFSLPKA